MAHGMQRCDRMKTNLYGFAFSLLLLPACGGSTKPAEEPDGPAERAGEKADQAADEAAESAEDASEEAGDKAEEAGDEIKEETKDEE